MQTSEQAAQLHRLGTSLAGRYVVEREVGRGGMATVYVAHDVRHGRRVALKVLDPELGAVLGPERFLSEIRVTAALQHPNLLPLFDSGDAGGLLYYVMPYVDGETLRAKLVREKQLPVREAVEIAAAVANALDYAHRHGVVHRDLKPENILLHEGQPLVADFGIALAVRNAGGNRLTQTGLSLGTPQYMSPEQAAGDRAIDGRTDIYSLAAVLYEMLVGDPPHIGSTAQAVIAKVLTERVQSMRALRDSVPEHVDAAVIRALAKLPADRWSTAQEFAEALTHARAPSDTAPGVALGGALARSASYRSNRLRAVTAVSAGLTCVLAAVVLWQAKSLRTRREDPTVRFSVDSLQLPSVSRGIAFSPDGRVVAYIAITGPGRSIVVRALDSQRSRVLLANGGFGQIFFSADSKSIGFVSGSIVQRIAVAGGTAVEVARLKSPVYGGAWTPAGEIVLGTSTGLIAVPASGGAPRRLTSPDSAHGETSQRWPLLLPDGKTIVYESAGRGGTDDARIGIASLSTGTSARTSTAGVCPVGYVGDQLVFATKNGVLMTGHVDLGHQRITQDPTPVLDSLGVDGDGGIPAAMSGDGSLAYQEGLPLKQVVAVDARGLAQPILAAPRAYANPQYSPDGRRIAVSIRTPAGTDIWIYDLAASTLTRLTADGTSNTAPEWTRDGKRVLWISNRGGSRAVWWQSADGSGTAQLLLKLVDREVTAAAFTSDGTRIVYSATDPANPDFGSDLWWRNSRVSCAASSPCDTTAHAVSATRFFEGQARPSPDGHWIAYTSMEPGDPQIFVRSFPDVQSRYQISTRRAMAPVWSPDSKTLYYIAADSEVRDLVAAKLRPSPDFNVLSRATVYHGAVDMSPSTSSYDVSPDGAHLLVVQRAGTERIVIVHNWAAELRSKLRETGQ
ncbi:MAG TPA: protein kinase [Gemmatimonadaceae bacterium]|jgi:eukaryotic-like serine/threonine-protein kinase|nr:protein kinase [Gemmatimonadaceae bacterium]